MAYLDIDVHHADGVQEILNEDPRVLTVSLHESGKYLFPGTGEIRELGSGAGRGLKLNLPLEPFTEGASYLEVLELVIPAALRHFRPDVLVVQAGADAHFDDPLSDLMLTTRDYEAIFRRILAWADDVHRGPGAVHAGRRLLVPRGAARVGDPLPRDARPRRGAGPSGDPGAADGATPRKTSFRTRFHDPNPSHADIPNRYEIAHRNRQVAERLLDLTRQYWFPK